MRFAQKEQDFIVTGFLTRILAASCLAGLAMTTPALAQETQQAAGAQPEQVLKSTHGAWEIYCLKGTETCGMQHVGKTADDKRALVITVERLAGVTADGKSVAAALTVRTPLGTLIPYGVRVKIDDGEVHPVNLVRCVPNSCLARAPLTEQDVALFKQGSQATFGFFLTEEVLVNVSLSGFTAAYESLKPIEVKRPSGQ